MSAPTGSFRAVQFDPSKKHCVSFGTVPNADIQRSGGNFDSAAIAVIERELNALGQGATNVGNEKVNIRTRIGRHIAEPLPTGNRRC